MIFRILKHLLSMAKLTVKYQNGDDLYLYLSWAGKTIFEQKIDLTGDGYDAELPF